MKMLLAACWRSLFLGLLLLCVESAESNADEPIRLPAVKDNSIVLVDGEWNHNAGSSPRIRVKGNQHLVVLGFDTQALRGRRVERAVLVCFAEDPQVDKAQLHGVTISTLATPWSEEKSTGLTAGDPNVIDWGYPGAKLPVVCGGNSFTLTWDARQTLREGRYEWELPASLVECLSLGVAHGLVIHEHDVDYSRNPTIFSREQSGRAPYLLVELDSDQEPDPTPAPPSDLSVEFVHGSAALLGLRSPESGFAYEVRLNGHELGRHNIPLLQPNTKQSIWLRDLPADKLKSGPINVEVVAINRTGQRSRPAVLTTTWPTTEKSPAESLSPLSSAAIPKDFSVIPVLDKFDRDGKPIGELPVDYRWRNPVFDGREVRLTAAAGEVVSFQLLLRGAEAVAVELKWRANQTAPSTMRVDWCLANEVESNGRWVPDPLLPMPARVPLDPNVDKVLVADLYVPFDRPPGECLGMIQVSDGREIPVRLEVLPFALPKTATFHCDMNSYGLPDHVQHYYDLQQVAYDHRVSCNVLHYGHHTAAAGARKSNLDMRLGNGRRMDNRRYDDIAPGATQAYWDDFVTAFDPVLSGSLFKDGHRGPLPLPTFYLTFHESWPLNCRAYFNGNPDAYEAFTHEPLYSQTYESILRDFVRLARERGWNKTEFQVYFNNKGSLSELTKSPWILDEPAGFWDYRALQFFGELTDRGRTAAANVQVDYRVDISRPEFCRGQLSSRRDLWVVSTWAFQNYQRLVQDRIKQDGLKVWVYGTANHVHESNRSMQAWALDAWLGGAVGLVPWQTVDKTGQALKQADQLGLFIFDESEAGQLHIRHSLRLKAFRDAEQLIAYLTELERRESWSRNQTREFVEHYVGWSSSVVKTNDADAGTPDFSGVTAVDLDRLRRACIQRLTR